MKPKSTLRNFLLTAGSSLFAMSYSHAASGNWTATGGGNWSTATSWSSNPTVPGTAAGDIIGLTSNIGAAANVTINTTPRTVGILNIGDSDNTHAFTVNASGGGTLTFNNGGSGAQINEVGSVGDTISAPITLADNLAITAVGTLSMTGIIGETGGARSITMTGGALTLNTGNTYSGGITLNSVFLTIPAGTYGGFGSGTFTTTVGSLALAGDSSMTIGNALNWGGSLTLQRSGGSANALPTFSGALTLSSNLTLRLGSGTTRGTAIFTNNISGAFGITASSEGANAGTSVLTLSGANNTFSGGLTLTQPKANLTLNINSATALGATTGTLTIGGSTVTINNTSGAAITLANNNPLAINNNFTFTGSSDLNMGTGAVNLGNGTRTITTTAGTLTLGGVISNGGITKAGVGTLVLSGANNYTTATLVNVGLLNVTGSLTSAVTVASGAFLSGTGTTTGTLTLSAGSTIVGTTAGNSFRAATVGTTSAVNIVGNDGSGTIGSKTIGVVRYNTGTGPTTANFSTAGYHAGASVANVGTSGGETQLSYTSAARTWDSAAGT